MGVKNVTNQRTNEPTDGQGVSRSRMYVCVKQNPSLMVFFVFFCTFPLLSYGLFTPSRPAHASYLSPTSPTCRWSKNLSCGEISEFYKEKEKVHMWRKNDKYEVWPRPAPERLTLVPLRPVNFDPHPAQKNIARGTTDPGY